MTNGDVIRQMSDEELAELIVKTEYDVVTAILNYINTHLREQEEVIESAIEWLRDEAQEDE